MRSSKKLLALAGLVLALGLLVPPTVPAQSSHHVKGQVSRGGEPVAGVWVTVSGGGGRGSSLTQSDGRYYIGRLSRGRYRLRVTAGERELHSQTIQLPGDEQTDIELHS